MVVVVTLAEPFGFCTVCTPTIPYRGTAWLVPNGAWLVHVCIGIQPSRTKHAHPTFIAAVPGLQPACTNQSQHAAFASCLMQMALPSKSHCM